MLRMFALFAVLLPQVAAADETSFQTVKEWVRTQQEEIQQICLLLPEEAQMSPISMTAEAVEVVQSETCPVVTPQKS